MKVVESLHEVKAWRRELSREASLGLVPTMGALHEGHLSLARAARRECDAVAMSIFVNPTQFGAGEDLDSYPRDREGDTREARGAGVDLLWFGFREELYPPGFATQVSVPALGRSLCGRSRPHHFGGVALIVLKLFHIFRPRRAYFGLKDYQQFVLLRRMVIDLDLDLDLEVVPGAIVREASGLALSSRNLRLSDAGRAAAAVLRRGLLAGRDSYEEGERHGARLVIAATRPILAEPRVSLEYLDLVDPWTLKAVAEVAPGRGAVLAVAARVEGVRLIDNIALGAAAEGPA
ncbi:MAG: pantoate--beta-alanine ligase [Planctomycetota bacterium]